MQPSGLAVVLVCQLAAVLLVLVSLRDAGVHLVRRMVISMVLGWRGPWTRALLYTMSSARRMAAM